VKKAAKVVSRRSRKSMEEQRLSLTDKGEKMYSGQSIDVPFAAGMGKNRPAYLRGINSTPPGIDRPRALEIRMCAMGDKSTKDKDKKGRNRTS